MLKLSLVVLATVISVFAMGAYQGTCFGGTDPVEECVNACPIGCPAPQYWVCSIDGNRYCNECVADCHGGVDSTGAACDECTPAGASCITDPGDPGFPANCEEMGLYTLDLWCPTINTHCCAKTCGFMACQGSLDCIDIPGDSCDPNNGGADCPGYCIKS